jgi:hypothetical protein
MPASPITKEITLPDNWVHLQKTMIPDSTTSCYWSVWYNLDHTYKRNSIIPGKYDDVSEGTAWLMWCPIDDDPSVNDSWGHAEEIDDSCRNVLTAIESVYGVSFHDSIWVEMGKEEAFPHSNRHNL